MFDVGLSELVVIAVVALVVIGPKDLPRTLHAVGRWVGKARNLAGEFQRHLDDVVREADMEEYRKKAAEVSAMPLDAALERAVDPDGSIRKGLEFELDENMVPRPVAEPAAEAPTDTPATDPPAAPVPEAPKPNAEP